jgi:hypothetical protein
MLNDLKQDLSLSQEQTVDLSEKHQIPEPAKTITKKLRVHTGFILRRRQKTEDADNTMQMQTQGNIQSAQAAESELQSHQQKKDLE